jgi:hypothetical protein
VLYSYCVYVVQLLRLPYLHYAPATPAGTLARPGGRQPDLQVYVDNGPRVEPLRRLPHRHATPLGMSQGTGG